MATKEDEKEFRLEPETNGEKDQRADAGEWIRPFLTILGISANVRMACAQAGITRKTAYKWKEENKDFSEMWDSAVEDGLDVLEYALFKRELATSDRAAEFLLKVKRYKDALKLEHSGPAGGPMPVEISGRLDVVSIVDDEIDNEEE
jgi:hypothetical protein